MYRRKPLVSPRFVSLLRIALALSLALGACSQPEDDRATGRRASPDATTSEGAAGPHGETPSDPDGETPGTGGGSRGGAGRPSASSTPSQRSTSNAVPPMRGTRLRDAFYTGRYTGTITGIQHKLPAGEKRAPYHLRRSVDNGVVHLRFSRPDSDPDKIEEHDLVPSPEGFRGTYLHSQIAGEEPCIWDAPALLQFPAAPRDGDVYTQDTKCHTEHTQFAYRQELRVVGPTTATVDGAAVPAWRLQRVVDEQISGDRSGQGRREADEVWVADGPLLVSVDGVVNGEAAMGKVRNSAEYHFTLDRTAPPS